MPQEFTFKKYRDLIWLDFPPHNTTCFILRHRGRLTAHCTWNPKESLCIYLTGNPIAVLQLDVLYTHALLLGRSSKKKLRAHQTRRGIIIQLILFPVPLSYRTFYLPLRHPIAMDLCIIHPAAPMPLLTMSFVDTLLPVSMGNRSC